MKQLSMVSGTDTTPCFPRLLTTVLVDDNVWKDQVKTAEHLFGRLRNVRKISLGVLGSGPEAEITAYNTPVFQVGFTRNGRIGGLLSNHVD